jgi:hypothetical protein
MIIFPRHWCEIVMVKKMSPVLSNKGYSRRRCCFQCVRDNNVVEYLNEAIVGN